MTDTEIYEKYKEPVRRLAAQLTEQPIDAENVLQEVFCTYIKNKPSFKDEEHAAAWFNIVTVNAAKMLRKSQERIEHNDT